MNTRSHPRIHHSSTCTSCANGRHESEANRLRESDFHGLPMPVASSKHPGVFPRAMPEAGRLRRSGTSAPAASGPGRDRRGLPARQAHSDGKDGGTSRAHPAQTRDRTNETADMPPIPEIPRERGSSAGPGLAPVPRRWEFRARGSCSPCRGTPGANLVALHAPDTALASNPQASAPVG